MSNKTAQERAAIRRRRRLVAFVTLPGVLIGTAGVGTAYAQNWLSAPAAAQCTPVVVVAPAPGSFTTNILNASQKNGSAGTVARDLKHRGYVIGAVGNDSELRAVEGVGEVRYGRKGLDQALLVQQTLLPKARLVEDDRAGTTVDLVPGLDFTGITARAPRPPVYPDQVTVNVYNTTYYENLGTNTAAALATRGFHPGEISQDPKGSWVQDIAVVRYGEDADREAKLIQQQVAGSRLQLDPTMTGTAVDLLLGMKFTALADPGTIPALPKRVTPKPVTVARPCA